MMGGGLTTGWMWVWPVLILGGLVLIGVAVVRLMQGDSSSAASPGPSGSAARRILDERYARGEIDDEEYRRRRELLL